MGQFAGDEIGDGDQMAGGGVAAGLGLGGLDEGVGGLDAALVRLESKALRMPSQWSLRVLATCLMGSSRQRRAQLVPAVEQWLGVGAVGGGAEDRAQGLLDTEGAVRS